MSQQQEPIGRKDKYSGVYFFLIFPALFLFLFLFGCIDPPSDFVDGLFRYVTRMFIAAIICAFAWGISLLVFDKMSGKAQLWITIIIVAAVGLLYASGSLPNDAHNKYFYEGFYNGYHSGYEDAAGYLRPAYNAGIEAEIMIINDPEDYSAEGLYEDWEEEADIWSIYDSENDYLSDYGFYNKYK